MSPKIIQRTPDLGIGIKLQRVSSDLPSPKPPWWWGWYDSAGQRQQTLLVTRNLGHQLPEPIPAAPNYWPELWVAVVDNATDVVWHIEFTPELWVQRLETDGWTTGDEEPFTAWVGDTISLQRPGSLALSAESLFADILVKLPKTLKIGSETYYSSAAGGVTYWSL